MTISPEIINSSSQVSGKFPLRKLYFYLTQGCNLACRHCWLAPKYQGNGQEHLVMNVELFNSIIRQALPLGLKTVKLTGGEPFMHQGILDLLQIIRRENLRLIIETNGILTTPEIVESIGRFKRKFVAVSLDSADPDIHDEIRGVRGAHRKATAAIRALADAGIRTQVIMTIMRKNAAQIENLLKLAESLGVKSVKFNTVQPILRGEKLHKNNEALSIKELIHLSRWVLGDLSKVSFMKVSFSLPKSLLPFSVLADKKNVRTGNCAIFSILGVLADGSYALCGIGENIPEMVFGHASSVPLKEVWNYTPVLTSIREKLEDNLKGVCASCMFKKQCLGNCVAHNYYRSKDLFAPFWICEQAHKEGVFPLSRFI